MTVEVRNLVQLERWQFGIEITNDTDRPCASFPDLTALLTQGGGARELGTAPGHVPESSRTGQSAEGIVSFVAPTTAEELDLQVAVAGPDGEATGFVFGIPQARGDVDALSHSGRLALPRQPPVDAHVGEAVGLDVLLPGDMLEGDAFEPAAMLRARRCSGWRCGLFTR